MTAQDLEVGVDGYLIVVREPTSGFYAIYSKPKRRPQLILRRPADTEDQALLTQVWQAANDKARELGWIV